MKSASAEFSRHHQFSRHREVRRGVSIFPAAIGAFLLTACSLAPIITENSVDYNETVENVTNSVLVTNILRARDGAPLYFSDLSQIRGSLQLNLQAAQTTLPYAHFFNSSTPSLFQAGPLTVGTQPGFDFAPLNTKKFAQGILDGIDEKVFAYFIQRGINAKVFLNLVVSKIERYRMTGPGKATYLQVCPDPRCLATTIGDWTADDTRQPILGRVSNEFPVGPPIPAEILARQDNILRNLVKVDDSDLDLNESKKQHSYRLSKTTSNFVLCATTRPGNYNAVGIAAPGATKDAEDPTVPTENGTCGKGSLDPYRYVLYTRSVEAIFYYLGGLLKHPENSPIPFHIFDYPVEGTRFHASYRGKTYFVREMIVEDHVPVDLTVSILAVLNDLLNLSRDADEIPSTKTVATSP